MKKVVALAFAAGIGLMSWRYYQGNVRARKGLCRKCGSKIISDPHELYAHCPGCQKYV